MHVPDTSDTSNLSPLCILIVSIISILIITIFFRDLEDFRNYEASPPPGHVIINSPSDDAAATTSWQLEMSPEVLNKLRFLMRALSQYVPLLPHTSLLPAPMLISYTHTEPPSRPTATSMTVTPNPSPTQPLNPSNLVTQTPIITITTTNLPRPPVTHHLTICGVYTSQIAPPHPPTWSPSDPHHPWTLPIPPHTEQLRHVLNPSCQLWQAILEHFCPETRTLCSVVSIVNHSPLHPHQTHITLPLHISFPHPQPFTHFPPHSPTPSQQTPTPPQTRSSSSTSRTLTPTRDRSPTQPRRPSKSHRHQKLAPRKKKIPVKQPRKKSQL